MGKWLSQLRSNYSESLGQGTTKTVKTTLDDGEKNPVLLEQGTTKTTKTPISNFSQLVRHYGADHQCLLSYKEIMAGLNADDIACLLHLERSEKQAWAEMLAHRLVRERHRVV